MAIVYRKNTFLKGGVSSEIVCLNDSTGIVVDMWTRYYDRGKARIFENDIVRYAGEKYVVEYDNGSFVYRPILGDRSRLAWYDEVSLTERVARKSVVISNTYKQGALLNEQHIKQEQEK